MTHISFQGHTDMVVRYTENIYHLPQLENCKHVFRDRTHAGRCLADMIGKTEGVLLGVPAGGIPVAIVVTTVLDLPMDVAVVNKITLPWNTEAGYGAVAFDGTIQLNRDLVDHLGLTDGQVRNGIRKTTEKVFNRIKRFKSVNPITDLGAKSALVVDDGLASGSTMRAAVEALTKAGFEQIVVAVPTAHVTAVHDIARHVSAVYCANMRSGRRFAVADAYQSWTDVTDDEVEAILKASGILPATDHPSQNAQA